MKRVTLNLKNCYGIKELSHDFDFTTKYAYAIYAPNGVMKSSLAQTFLDAAKQEDSRDRVYSSRKTSRIISDEAGKAIEGERILVVPPYDEEFGPTEKTSTLLVDAKLRKEHEGLQATIDKATEALLTEIRQQSGSKRNLKEEISSAITRSSNKFEDALTRVQKEIEKQKDTPFATVKYDIIFNDKIQKALREKNLKDAIEDYIRRYNELLAASTYFRKGTFDYYNAGQIAKNLAEHGFFKAQHTVSLKNAEGALEIKTEQQLEDVIAKEKAAIMTDKKLREKFNAVEKQCSKNAELREFCRYLQDNEPILSRLNNIDQFREDVIKSYLKSHEVLYINLMKVFESVEKRRKEIEAKAQEQKTQWDTVIAIFNARFFVPFELVARNRIAVMLGDERIPQLGFRFKDMGGETTDVEKSDLMTVLSTGERKALYILNVIFEIQRRKKEGVETLMIVDDIADSFDYQNKYAIIHYLKEVIEDNNLFKMIIMTHNFDFFRTIEGRFVGYPCCLMASKNEQGVTLVKAAGIRNIFANDWKGKFFDDSKKKIASIPFLRNLIEMTIGESAHDYKKLTSMLHWKTDTDSITVKDLDTIFNALCKTSGTSEKPDKKVFDLVVEQAEECLVAGPGLNLENKIVLAIGIRLLAERFMINKINDPTFVNGIQHNQTQALIDRFKNKHPGETNACDLFDLVALMTPENIHVNSFMYEPIIDMSDDHLRRLFNDIKRLA